MKREDQARALPGKPRFSDEDASPERQAAAAAVASLLGAFPVIGNALSGASAFVNTRADALRWRQLNEWLESLRDAVERLSRTALDRDWLESDEAHRVFTALWESSLDILREDKVRLLAGAAVKLASLPAESRGFERRFTQIIIDLDLDELRVLSTLAASYGQNEERWVLNTSTRRAALNHSAANLFGPAFRDCVTAELLQDALRSMDRYGLAVIIREQTQGGDYTPQISIRPRERWNKFAAFLLESISLVATGGEHVEAG